MNKVLLVGNVGKVSELKQASSTQVINVSLATKEGETSIWHKITAFGKTAENVSKYVSVGDKIAIEGKLSYRDYEKDGVKHYTTDIIAVNIEFISKSTANKQPSTQTQVQAATQPNQAPTFADNSELPF